MKKKNKRRSNSKRSSRSRRSNSTRGRRKSRLGDWLGGWHSVTADSILSNSMRHLAQPPKYDGWTWVLRAPPPAWHDKPLRVALVHYAKEDKSIVLSFWPSDEVREVALMHLLIDDPKIEHKRIGMQKPYKYTKGRGWKLQK